MYTIIFQRLLLEAFLDLLYFPIWWYSGGIKFFGRWCWQYFLAGNARLLPGLWLKNIFVPMFGQYDWQGRIISFFMRLVQVILRSIVLAVWGLLCIVLFIIWLVLPVVITWGLITSLNIRN